MEDLMDEIFFDVMEKANLINILGTEGRLIVLQLSRLCMENKMGKESQAISDKIFEATNDKNWLAGMMAIFFALDMMLQNNPLIARKAEGKAIEDLISQLEAKMRGNKHEKDKGKES